jgi:hypothetical protein
MADAAAEVEADYRACTIVLAKRRGSDVLKLNMPSNQGARRAAIRNPRRLPEAANVRRGLRA